MNYFKALYLRWLCRDQTHEHLAESYHILLKSARRCAYDLRHAVEAISIAPSAYEIFKDRSRMWLKIFCPDGVKDYRLELHQDIDRLEREVFALRAELKEHNIQSKVPTNYPF